MASATTTGVETNIVEVSRRCRTPRSAPPAVALFALLILPVALAVRELVRRQGALAEAVATGVLTPARW